MSVVTPPLVFNYYKAAFFSAFTTLPGFQQSAQFFFTDISRIFDTYRDGLAIMEEKARRKKRKIIAGTHLYRPVPYCLFGEFDMAIFSMIDDLSFASQHFKPPPSSKKGFKYQINSGVIPLVDAYAAKYSQLPAFEKKYLPDFFAKKTSQLYPFTGIASVKLNNAMLVGTGRDFMTLINFYLVTYLDAQIEKLSKAGAKMIYILNENLGWNELAIYFFGNSMEAINYLLMDFRQFTLKKIETDLHRYLREAKYDHRQIKKKILPVLSRIKRHSLLSDFIRKEGKPKVDILQSHPFIATSLTFGFRPELIDFFDNDIEMLKRCNFSSTQLRYFKEECSRPDFISIGWKIKPGHEEQADGMIRKWFPEYRDHLTDTMQSGKYPFTFPKKPISLSEYLLYARKEKTITEDEKSLHVIKIRSSLHWKKPVKTHTFNESGHHRYHFEKYQINEEQIKEIQKYLFVYPISFTFKNQLESLIINYNDAINDPMMYNYFVGLKDSLINFLKYRFSRDLLEDKQTKLTVAKQRAHLMQEEDIHEVLSTFGTEIPITIKDLNTHSITDFIQNWNKAYWNRYFHSYYFTEINDFNIEHHGGIQQILFSYDTIYRLINKRIYGQFSTTPFVNVQVGPNIFSTEFYNTINFTHLFRPAIYACECVHEAANHIIPSLVKFRNCLEYAFLFDPDSDNMTADTESRHLELEARLESLVGPRDNYERNYLHVHFGLNSIRHIVTDFVTYILAYSDPYKTNLTELWQKKDLIAIRFFYHSHWFLLLLRTDLYYRETRGKGNWFFKDGDFQALFMRFNLMFYLFLELDREKLDELNEPCPSIELKAIWETEKEKLLDLVERLGDALRNEFKKQMDDANIKVRTGEEAIHRFRDKIISKVLNKGWREMSNDEERDAYKNLIRVNQEIISRFHDLFTETKLKCNTLIRESSMRGHELKPNITFREATGRSIFLDPKGNLFITSSQKRNEVLRYNIEYLKKIWDLSLRISRNDY